MERLSDRKAKKDLYKHLAAVAIPIALQSLVSSSLNLVDNLMVGMLGESELAGVGAGMQIFFIGWIIAFGFSSGVSTFVAQFWGAGDTVNIKKTMGFALTVNGAIGVVFFLISFLAPWHVMRVFTDIPETLEIGSVYVKTGSWCFLLMPVVIILEMALRSTQQTRIPMFVSFIAFGANTFMNWVLIFGHLGAPAMGVKGAALATVISRIIETLLDFFVIFVRKNVIGGRPGEYLGWSRQLGMRVVRNALPTTFNEGAWSVATTMYVAAYARVGVTEYAAFQAAETIDNLFMMAAFSLGDAALIILGQLIGEKKPKEAYEMGRTILRACAFVGILMSFALLAASGPMVSLYDFTPRGAFDAKLILFVYSVALTFDVMSGALVSGILRSGGDTRFAMAADLGTIWLIGVPMAWITTAVLGLPIYVAVALAKLELVVKLVILMKRFVSGKWVNNVVEDFHG